MAKSHLRLLSSSSESEDSCDEDQDGASMNPRRGISDDSEDSEDEMDCNEEEDEIFQDPGSDGDASCAICLNEFTKQKVGVPNNCRHIFCVDCILEWSKNANSCPVDRIEFEAIQVYRRFGGVFVHELVVEKKINVVETHENDTNCQVCGSGENEETLLLCDGCDLGYHCACLNPPLEQVPSDEWFCINCRPSHAAEPHPRHHRVIGRTLASERVRSDITRSRLRHSALVSSLDEQIDSIVTEILSNSGHRLRISNSSARRPRSSSRRSTSRKKRTGSKKRRSTSKKRTSKRRKTKRGRKTNKTPRHPMSNRVFGGRCDNNAGNSTTNDITNGTFSIMGGADDLDEYMQSRSDEGDPSYITAQKHRMLSLSAIRFNVPLPSLLSASSTRGMDRVSRPPPTPDLLGSILQSQEVLLAPTTNIQIQSGGKILLKPKSRTGPNELLPVSSAKEKLSKTPHTRQNGLSHTEKSGQSSKSKKEKETSSSSRSSHSNKPSSSKSSSSRDRGSTSSETSNQIEKSSHGSGGVKSEPPEDQDQDEKQMNKSDKKSSAAALKNRRILIRPVFNLPSGIQKSGSSSKDQSESQNVYDPFEPTEDDELSLHPHQEDLLYDPFQPTISDEEKEEKEKKDSSIETKEVKTKVKQEKKGSKESSKEIKEEPVFDLDVDAMLDDQLDAATDPVLLVKTPLKKEIKQEKVEEEKMESPPAPAHPPPKVKKERSDAVELDMFAEMELERVENATDVTRDEGDPLDSWRTNVPSSSDQVSLPGFSSSKDTSGPPIKFKKLNRKIRNSFSKENINQEDNEEKSVAESREKQEKPEQDEKQETQSGNTRNPLTKDELKKKSSGSRSKRSRSNSRSRVLRSRRSRSRSRNRRSSDARRRDSYDRRTSSSKYPRNRSRNSRSRSRSRDRKRRRSRSKDRSKDRKARSRSKSRRRSKSDLQSTSQPFTKESLEKKKEKKSEKRAVKNEEKSPEREKGKKSKEKSPESIEKIKDMEIKKEPVSNSTAVGELSESRGKNKDDVKSEGVSVKQSSNVDHEAEAKSKSKKRKIKEEVLSTDDNLEEKSEKLKSEHDIAGSSQEKTKLENKDSNLEGEKVVGKQDVKKKKKKKDDKEETGRPLKRKKSKHKDEESVSDLSVEMSKKKIKEEAASDHEKSHAKKHKKHKKHDLVKHGDASPVKSHKSHKKKKKKSHQENDDFADMLLEDLEVTIKPDTSDEKREKSYSSSKEQAVKEPETRSSGSSGDHRMLDSDKTDEKFEKLEIKTNLEESIDDMLEQPYFKQETTTESKSVEMNMVLDDVDAGRSKSSDCDMRSPSPISPILLSPDQSPLPGANHSLLSNDLKETPSYAEEFLEQSRKRWNENLRKKSVSVTPEDLPDKEAGIESSLGSQISPQKSDVKNSSNEVVMVKLDSDDHATVSDIFAESSGNVTPMDDSSQIAPENLPGEKTISIELEKNFEISKSDKKRESDRKENASCLKDKVETKRKTPEKSKSRSKSDKKHESTSKRRRSSDHSSSKKQRSSRSPRRRSERSRKRSRDSDSWHKPRRRSSRSHSSPDHQRRSDKHKRSPSPVKRRDSKNTHTYKTELKVEKVEEPQPISTITSQKFEPLEDNITQHDSQIHSELLFSAPNSSALIQINTVDQPVLMEDVSSKISTQQQQQLISNKNQSSDKTSPKTLPNKVPVAVISPTKQEVKAPELYSPSCPISPESPEPIGDLPPPPPPKINQSPAKVGVGVSKTSEVENEKKLNPTQILNIAGLNPTQQSAAKDAIMSIAELSRQLQLGQILPNKETSHKEKDGLSPVSIDNIESSAVEMYNKGKQKTLLKKLTFQQEVVEAAKSAIKPHYERREINKTQYKDIMKRAVNKICQADKTKIVNPVKVRRLIRRYVECYQRKNVKSKEKMKNVLDLKVEKHMRPKISDPSESPPSPIGSPLTAPESASEDTSNTPSLLKREPRKIVTLPDLPLPPPPPPPRPRY